MTKVCVIGGSRYFGKHVVRRLLAAGVDVTVVNRGTAPAPPGVTHRIADRDDEESLRTAVAADRFTVVIDQVCSTPRQAAIARRVFADRTDRYVMTSTIEVYDPATSDAIDPVDRPVTEDSIDLRDWPVRLDLPWDQEAFRAEHYGEGKRQAEAVFLRDAVFGFASIRSGHVLGGGRADFTGRLDHYIQRLRAGQPIRVHRGSQPSSFINNLEIADFVCRVAGADVVGPINACSQGQLTVTQLCDHLASAGLGTPRYEFVAPGEIASPFSYDRYYAMDNTRASRLGFALSRVTDWLPRVISEATA